MFVVINMKTSVKKNTSPVIQLLDFAYENALKAEPRSWQRINYAMRHALEIAIGSLFEFAIGDFKYICSKYKSDYWMGDEIERWYSHCVADGNVSAIAAFEDMEGRGPLIADDVTPVNSRYAHGTGSRAKERLHVGACFQWLGYRVTVTSFNADGSCNACAYASRRLCPEPNSALAKKIVDVRAAGHSVNWYGEATRKPIKRFKIDRDGIIAERANRKRRMEIHDAMMQQPDAIQKKFMDLIGNPKKDEFERMPVKKLEAVMNQVVETD